MQGLAVFRSADTGWITGEMTLSVKAFPAGTPVSTVGWTMLELFSGTYMLSIPLAIGVSIFEIYYTATPTKVVTGWLDSGENELFQITLNRLLEQKVSGSLVMVNPSPIDNLILFQYNDYPEFEISLQPQWATYLDGSYDIFFTINETMSAVDHLLEVTGSILDRATCTLRFPITVDDMDITGGSYAWQVQLRKPDPIDPALDPISVKVAAYGRVHVRRTFKGLPVPAGT